MSEGIKTHKDLDVWKLAIDFVTEIYQRTDDFPNKEEFGLKSQIRRAVVSIPANISEGATRNSTKEFLQFLHISLGSLSELETLLIISKNLGMLENEDLLEKLTVIRRMLLKLIGALNK
jgi:four helix bundle protein